MYLKRLEIFTALNNLPVKRFIKMDNTKSNLPGDWLQYGRIFTFIDFGNVNYWYERDERDGNGRELFKGEKLVIGIEQLATYVKTFSVHSRFYFGLDPKQNKSIAIIAKARKFFSKTVTKPIQKIKHYLSDGENVKVGWKRNSDARGQYIYLPKCNFDVEMCVDAIRLADNYDTFCLFSSDSDFASLTDYLKRAKNKKVILFSSGYVSYWLKDKVDLNINGQAIKKQITFKKIKPRL